MRGFPSSQGEESGEGEPREGAFRALSPSSETVVHPGFGTQTNDALETLHEAPRVRKRGSHMHKTQASEPFPRRCWKGLWSVSPTQDAKRALECYDDPLGFCLQLYPQDRTGLGQLCPALPRWWRTEKGPGLGHADGSVPR